MASSAWQLELWQSQKTKSQLNHCFCFLLLCQFLLQTLLLEIKHSRSKVCYGLTYIFCLGSYMIEIKMMAKLHFLVRTLTVNRTHSVGVRRMEVVGLSPLISCWLLFRDCCQFPETILSQMAPFVIKQLWFCCLTIPLVVLPCITTDFTFQSEKSLNF